MGSLFLRSILNVYPGTVGGLFGSGCLYVSRLASAYALKNCSASDILLMSSTVRISVMRACFLSFGYLSNLVFMSGFWSSATYRHNSLGNSSGLCSSNSFVHIIFHKFSTSSLSSVSLSPSVLLACSTFWYACRYGVLSQSHTSVVDMSCVRSPSVSVVDDGGNSGGRPVFMGFW